MPNKNGEQKAQEAQEAQEAQSELLDNSTAEKIISESLERGIRLLIKDLISKNPESTEAAAIIETLKLAIKIDHQDDFDYFVAEQTKRYAELMKLADRDDQRKNNQDNWKQDVSKGVSILFRNIKAGISRSNNLNIPFTLPGTKVIPEHQARSVNLTLEGIHIGRLFDSASNGYDGFENNIVQLAASRKLKNNPELYKTLLDGGGNLDWRKVGEVLMTEDGDYDLSEIWPDIADLVNLVYTTGINLGGNSERVRNRYGYLRSGLTIDNKGLIVLEGTKVEMPLTERQMENIEKYSKNVDQEKRSIEEELLELIGEGEPYSAEICVQELSRENKALQEEVDNLLEKAQRLSTAKPLPLEALIKIDERARNYKDSVEKEDESKKALEKAMQDEEGSNFFRKLYYKFFGNKDLIKARQEHEEAVYELEVKEESYERLLSEIEREIQEEFESAQLAIAEKEGKINENNKKINRSRHLIERLKKIQ